MKGGITLNLFKNILVAYDGSEKSKEALIKANEIATNETDCHVHIVTVWQPLSDVMMGSDMYMAYQEFIETSKNEANQKLETAKSLTENIADQRTALLIEGHPASEIICYAKQNDIDLIIIGSRGLSGLKKWILGSVSYHVVQEADCAVLVIK